MNMKKIVLSLFLTVLLVGLCSGAALAADYPSITVADSADFTMVLQEQETEEVTIIPLDEYWMPDEFAPGDADNLSWASSNTSIATVTPGPGNDTATIQAVGKGRAQITVTYDNTNGPDVSVPIYVVVEDQEVQSVTVNVQISGPNLGTITKNNLYVPLFDLSDTLPNVVDNDDDVLKKTPSALHALIQALIDEKGLNWVNNPANLVISSQGSYVDTIDGDAPYTDENGNFYGWQYKVRLNNNLVIEPDFAASAFEVQSGGTVIWYFDKYEF